MSAGALGRGEGILIASEAVVQHCGRVLGQCDCPALALGGAVLEAEFDQLQCRTLVAAPSGEHQ